MAKTHEVRDPEPLPLRLRVAALVTPTLVFLALLLTVEAAVRGLLPEVSQLEALVRSERQLADFADGRKVGIVEADPLLAWRLKPNLRNVLWDFTLLSTNAQGLRGTRDLGPKGPRTTRVVCLGDSVTFGYRVPVVFAERPTEYDPAWRPYPELLESWLSRGNPDREVEALCLAVPGYSSHQGLAWLRRDIDRLEPDILTVCFGWNDVDLRRAPDSRTIPVSWRHQMLRRVWLGSQALIHLSRGLERWRAPEPTPPGIPRVSEQEYVRNHVEIVRLARERGAQVLVIAPVYRDAETAPEEARRLARYRDAVEGRMEREGVAHLRVEALTEAGFPDNRRLFGERIHPNHAGHRLLAVAVLDRLASGGMLLGMTWTGEPPDS